jgi:hypothetical protein
MTERKDVLTASQADLALILLATISHSEVAWALAASACRLR